MSNYTKWIAGGLGWAFLGPIGGILGFVFGSMIDSTQGGGSATRQTMFGDFSASLLILSAAVMKADNRVTKAELDYVRNFFRHNFGEEVANEKILILREILKQDINVAEVAQQISQFMEYPDRLQLLHYLFGISMADGSAHPAEIDMLALISNYLGINQNEYLSIKNMFVKELDSAYRILEISPEATDEEVKKAYRQMAMKYHPDRVSDLGDDVQRASKEKFQQLQNAYEEIKKQRGIS